ncbi:C-signal-like [Glandiceps talaboti]
MASMCMKSVLVTGCSRGIGLELIKQFVKLPNPPQHVFATCRSPENAHELKNIAESNSSVQILQLDIEDYTSINDTACKVEQIVGDNGLNLLINNAGAFTSVERKIEAVESETLLKIFQVNTLGPIMVIKRFLPLLRSASSLVEGDEMSVSRAAIINMSSRLSSFDDNKMGCCYSSRCSKVALNMVTLNLSLELAADNILAVSLNPGYVRTQGGGPDALIDTTESVEGLMNVMATRTKEHSGYFYNYDGKLIPW